MDSLGMRIYITHTQRGTRLPLNVHGKNYYSCGLYRLSHPVRSSLVRLEISVRQVFSTITNVASLAGALGEKMTTDVGDEQIYSRIQSTQQREKTAKRK